MNKIKTSLIFYFMFSILLLFLFVLSSYKYHDKELVEGVILYKNQSVILSPESGYIENIYQKNNSFVDKNEEILSVIPSYESLRTQSGSKLTEAKKKVVNKKIQDIEQRLNTNIESIKNRESELLVKKKLLKDAISGLKFVLDNNVKIYKQEKKRQGLNAKLRKRNLISENEMEKINNQVSIFNNEVIDVKIKIANHESELYDVSNQIKQLKNEKENFLSAYRTEKVSQEHDLIELESHTNLLIESPASGVVFLDNIKVGQFVQKNQPVGKVVTDQKLIVQLNISSKSKAQTNIGDKVVMEVDSLPFADFGLVIGEIKSVHDISSPDSEFIKIVEVSITESSNNKLLKNGMSVNGYISAFETSLLKHLLLPFYKAVYIDSSLVKK